MFNITQFEQDFKNFPVKVLGNLLFFLSKDKEQYHPKNTDRYWFLVPYVR